METTMNPDTRRLLPVALGEFDQDFSEARFNMLMGKGEAAARRFNCCSSRRAGCQPCAGDAE